MKKIIVANLKMNFGLDEAINYKNSINEKFDNLIVCPPYIYIRDMMSDNYIIGSQDGYYIDKGAYTGEISFNQLNSIGVKYSIIGHSERRHKLFEDNKIVKDKYVACLNNNITPILCVGETLEERQNNKTLEIIRFQLESIFKDYKIENVIIAYEPVWAIGTNVTPTLIEIEEVHQNIKNIMNELNIETKILYGGSVNINNIEAFSKSNYIEGFLIGSASLDPNNLMKMIKITM